MKFKLSLLALLVVAATFGGIVYANQRLATAPMDGIAMDQSPMPDSSMPAAAPNTVTIAKYQFCPANLTVKKGTTVTWTNTDLARHNVVVDDGAPAGGPSGPLFGKGETYAFTFNTVGTFPYHCSPHPYMMAQVVVTE